jgi:hypothetical protein
MRFVSLFLCALTIGLAALRADPTREIHLGLSPFLNTVERDAFVQELPGWLLDKASAPAGTRLIFWDAWNLTVISELTIPTLQIDTPRSRTPRLVSDLATIGRWLRSSIPAPEGISVGSGAVRAPEWLFETSATSATASRTLILVGSPLYRSPAEPAFDMAADARFPSDGHLALGLRDSVFGLLEKSGRLERTTVHWVYAGQSLWANELHRHSVTRFWTLFIQGQGGTLATFGADVRAALARAVQSGLRPVLHVQPDSADEKPLMRSARPRSLPVWLETLPAPQSVVVAPLPVVETPTAAVPQRAAVAPQPAPSPLVTEIPLPGALTPAMVEPATPPPPPAPASLPMPRGFDSTRTGIGIAWPAAIDLDLHVRLRPGVKELSYRVDRTSEGRLYRDEQKANAGAFFEFVEFTGTEPIDLSRASVWVHFYSGRAKNVTGQVVLFDRGQTKTGTFSIRAEKGNGNDPTTQRANSPYWVEIHLAELGATAVPLIAAKPGGVK